MIVVWDQEEWRAVAGNRRLPSCVWLRSSACARAFFRMRGASPEDPFGEQIVRWFESRFCVFGQGKRDGE